MSEAEVTDATRTRRGAASRLSMPIALAAATLVFSVAPLLPSPLRAIVVLPLAFVLPGAAMTLALGWPRSDVWAPIAFGLRVVLSLAFYPMLALALFALHIRYSTAAWILGTDVFIVAAMAVAAFSRRTETATAPNENVGVSRDGLGWLLWLVGVVALATVALVATNALVPGAPKTQFSAISLRTLPAGDQVVVPAGQSLRVPIEITNSTSAAQTYRVRAQLDARPFGTDQRVRIEPGAKWTGEVTGAVPADGCLHHLQVSATDASGVDRSVALFARSPGRTACPK
jgi:uncharacterized membrane protein